MWALAMETIGGALGAIVAFFALTGALGAMGTLDALGTLGGSGTLVALGSSASLLALTFFALFFLDFPMPRLERNGEGFLLRWGLLVESRGEGGGGGREVRKREVLGFW
jgi:hypothetical protein